MTKQTQRILGAVTLFGSLMLLSFAYGPLDNAKPVPVQTNAVDRCAQIRASLTLTPNQTAHAMLRAYGCE